MDEPDIIIENQDDLEENRSVNIINGEFEISNASFQGDQLVGLDFTNYRLNECSFVNSVLHLFSFKTPIFI